MLAVVKTPHIELALNGDRKEAMQIIRHLRKKFTVDILDSEVSYEKESDGTISVRETDWWEEREEQRPGVYVRGGRYKLGVSQKELSELTGIAVPVISDYENNKRKITEKAAYKLAKAFNCQPNRFLS